jgi:hypothetical protein
VGVATAAPLGPLPRRARKKKTYRGAPPPPLSDVARIRDGITAADPPILVHPILVHPILGHLSSEPRVRLSTPSSIIQPTIIRSAATASKASKATPAVARPLMQTERVPVIHGDDDELVCVVCMDALRVVTFVPCGHLSVCMSCCAMVRKGNNTCPLCRSRIDHAVRCLTHGA